LFSFTAAGSAVFSKLNEKKQEKFMQIAMIICQDSPEVLWNSFRLANMMLEGMDDVAMFLNGPSVKYEDLDSERFPLKELARIFTLSEGELFA
jgi:uncharacterized protein involved in oxidation of intracellular sulfur